MLTRRRNGLRKNIDSGLSRTTFKLVLVVLTRSQSTVAHHLLRLAMGVAVVVGRPDTEHPPNKFNVRHHCLRLALAELGDPGTVRSIEIAWRVKCWLMWLPPASGGHCSLFCFGN